MMKSNQTIQSVNMHGIGRGFINISAVSQSEVDAIFLDLQENYSLIFWGTDILVHLFFNF